MHLPFQKMLRPSAVVLWIAAGFAGTAVASEQDTTPSASISKTKVPSKSVVKATAGKAVNANSAASRGDTSASLPTKAEVESFLHHMFGYNPAATWKIIDIQPSEAPHVAHVIAVLGNNQTATHLYITPDGKNAVVGDMIPFGADPYEQIRGKLSAGKGFSRGNANAPVTIIEFSDLQCPYCKSAQPIIDRLMQEMPNTRLVFQPFPLAMHKWALKAASYGQCVGEQNPTSFWKFVQGVYDAQETVTEANAEEKLTAIAKGTGADSTKAAACAANPNTFIRVQQSIDLGKSVGVGGTPTVFINGRKISAIKEVPFDLLKAMVNFDAAENKSK